MTAGLRREFDSLRKDIGKAVVHPGHRARRRRDSAPNSSACRTPSRPCRPQRRQQHQPAPAGAGAGQGSARHAGARRDGALGRPPLGRLRPPLDARSSTALGGRQDARSRRSGDRGADATARADQQRRGQLAGIAVPALAGGKGAHACRRGRPFRRASRTGAAATPSARSRSGSTRFRAPSSPRRRHPAAEHSTRSPSSGSRRASPRWPGRSRNSPRTEPNAEVMERLQRAVGARRRTGGARRPAGAGGRAARQADRGHRRQARPARLPTPISGPHPARHRAALRPARPTCSTAARTTPSNRATCFSATSSAGSTMSPSASTSVSRSGRHGRDHGRDRPRFTAFARRLEGPERRARRRRRSAASKPGSKASPSGSTIGRTARRHRPGADSQPRGAGRGACRRSRTAAARRCRSSRTSGRASTRSRRSLADQRNAILEAARQRRRDAVRSFGPAGSEPSAVVGLADDLKALETLTRRSDERNSKTFEAIHDTLLKIVDRLGLDWNAGRPRPGRSRAARSTARRRSTRPTRRASTRWTPSQTSPTPGAAVRRPSALRLPKRQPPPRSRRSSSEAPVPARTADRSTLDARRADARLRRQEGSEEPALAELGAGGGGRADRAAGRARRAARPQARQPAARARLRARPTSTPS